MNPYVDPIDTLTVLRGRLAEKYAALKSAKGSWVLRRLGVLDSLGVVEDMLAEVRLERAKALRKLVDDNRSVGTKLVDENKPQEEIVEASKD